MIRESNGFCEQNKRINLVFSPLQKLHETLLFENFRKCRYAKKIFLNHLSFQTPEVTFAMYYIVRLFSTHT